MALKLDDAAVRKLEAPAVGNRITYDSEVKGFGVRVTKAGAKSFILNYRTAGGLERRYTIGSCGDWQTGAARKRAKELKIRVDRGEDPMGERHEERAAPTIANLCDRYETTHMKTKRPGSQAEDKAMIAAYIKPRLGSVKVADLRHVDCEDLHRWITEKGKPIRANRVAALMSKLLALAVKWELRTDNPVKGIERNPENKRTRYLSPAEIAELSKALVAHPNKAACNAIRLMLLTGARSGEVLRATWDQFDLEAGIWTKPGATTKQRSEHRVPISAAALLLLKGMREKQRGEFLFYGRSGKEPLPSVRTTWEALCRTAGLSVQVKKLDAKGRPVKDKEGEPVLIWQPTVRVHDLRHTYASLLVSAGQSLPIIGALLGHSVPQTTARYAHLFDDPLRQATEHVGAIVTGQAAAEVKSFPRKRRAAPTP